MKINTSITPSRNFLLGLAAVIVVIGGLTVGFIVSNRTTSSKVLSTKTSITESATEAGAKDSSAFKDTATGMLQVGGIKGEGTYHLDRPGGEMQTVCLTSTVIDLSPFVGKKVQVWGQTQASQYAPWFMDVGKIKVVE